MTRYFTFHQQACLPCKYKSGASFFYSFLFCFDPSRAFFLWWLMASQGFSSFGDWWSVPSVSWFSRDLTPSFFQSLILLSPYYKIAFLVSVVWFPKSIHIVSKGMLKGYLSSRHNHSLAIVPCWRGMPYLLYFSFSNTSIIEISNYILKLI